VTIAIELLNEIRQFDPSVLNPINFMMATLLELAIKRSGSNKTFCAWILKIYCKLGLTSLVTDVSKSI
jgi:hypothetical protein